MKSLARNRIYLYLGVEWFKDVGVVLFYKAIYIASWQINKESIRILYSNLLLGGLVFPRIKTIFTLLIRSVIRKNHHSSSRQTWWKSWLRWS